MPKGHHGLEFEVVEGWERLPEGWSFTEVAGGRDRLARPGVRLLPRRAPPHRVRQGRQVSSTPGGRGCSPARTGIFIDHLDQVHLVDCWDHTIRTFTTGGTLLRTVGESGRCSDTGFEPDVSPVQ